ncbi:MAG: hypothetical protein IPK72_21190 [Candidatus Eisenbacteria bacterium]|nr:hypothetical protein [Candidatus Eisenbacteria bacterium]
MSSKEKPSALASVRSWFSRRPPQIAVSMGFTPEREEGLWLQRNLLGRVPRSLHASDQAAMIEKCYALYTRNPFARRIVEMQKAFVIGTGFKFRAEHPVIDTLLGKAWERNKMSQRIPNIQRDKSIFGEHNARLLVNAAGNFRSDQ